LTAIRAAGEKQEDTAIPARYARAGE
jgi:hypothetical protein